VFDGRFRPSFARQAEGTEGLLPARVVDRRVGRVCGFEVACYAAVDLVRKLFENMSGKLTVPRFSLGVKEREALVVVCFPWRVGQGWDVVESVVSNFHWGSSASIAPRLLIMLGYVDALL
jgi:hypothetical protein